ncbi:modb7.2 protein [Murid betaherpesvirus 1]|uniref:Modb7.2 protein n=1 Tax=Murid herpesvirus 1 TaxID=10366 RepID=H2A3E9_MUHV1|nr:modb7.2 protein [Murid betaherpesvirus 1]
MSDHTGGCVFLMTDLWNKMQRRPGSETKSYLKGHYLTFRVKDRRDADREEDEVPKRPDWSTAIVLKWIPPICILIYFVIAFRLVYLTVQAHGLWTRHERHQRGTDAVRLAPVAAAFVIGVLTVHAYSLRGIANRYVAEPCGPDDE